MREAAVAFLGAAISPLRWIIERFQKQPAQQVQTDTEDSVQQTQSDATDSVQQTQTAGRDAFQAGRDLILQQPVEADTTTVAGTDLRDLILAETEPVVLCQFFKDYTQIQANRHIEPYKGKWIRLSGFIKDVSELTKGAILVSVDIDLIVFMFFSDTASIEHISMKSKGDKIAAIGKISEVSAYDFTIIECELLIE